MKKVFFGGSRRLGRLSPQVKERASSMIAEGLVVLVGDANGADKAIQQFFAEHTYKNVIVFYAGNLCRNNVGNWSTHPVPVERTERDFQYYAAKDLAMAEEADYGLMIWDGESAGTVNNVLNLLERGKKVVVYLSPQKQFVTFKTPTDAGELLKHVDPSIAGTFDKKIGFYRRVASPQHALRLAS